jgi:hypothetical protein
VRPEQVQLEPLGVSGGDADAGELADPGRDPIDGLTTGDGVLDDRPRSANPLPSDAIEPGRRRTARDRFEPVERERFGEIHGRAPYPGRLSGLGVRMEHQPRTVDSLIARR